MCRGPAKDAARPRLLLVSVESFCENGNALPDKGSLVFTGLFIIALLCLSEMTWRQIIESVKVNGLDILINNNALFDCAYENLPTAFQNIELAPDFGRRKEPPNIGSPYWCGRN
jgi:hypothetical protein